MDRRDFLKLAASTGLAVVTTRSARAQCVDPPASYDGPLWIFVHAVGGWDPTLLCDPKPALNRTYSTVGTQGNLTYAPVATHAAFFQAHGSDLLVINGIDAETNNHDVGTRYTWSGRLSLSDAHPSLPALIAAAGAPGSALPFLTTGGYDYPAGIVSPTRIGKGSVLPTLTDPNHVLAADTEAFRNERYHSDATLERIRTRQQERRTAFLQQRRVLPVRRELAVLFAARASEAELRRLDCHLPSTLDPDPFKSQVQLAMASYLAGFTACVTFSHAQFDTHGNHDTLHVPAMSGLLAKVDFIMQQAAQMMLRDRVVVVVGSDFGRTPGYNGENGKDHWPITSMMLLAPSRIRGNRVIGGTDDGLRAYKVDPTTLASDVNGTNPAAITLRPTHIHRALRSLAGVDGSEVAQRFPLTGVPLLPLFT